MKHYNYGHAKIMSAFITAEHQKLSYHKQTTYYRQLQDRRTAVIN